MSTAALILLVITTLSVALLDHRLGSEERAVLQSHLDAAAATVSVGAHGHLVVQDGQGDGLLDTGVWIFEGSSAVEQPPRAARLEPEAASLAGTSGRRLRREDEPATDFRSVAITSGGRQVGTVVAAISLAPYQRSTRLTLVGAGALGFLLELLIAVVAYRVAGLALEPVADMARQARAWSDEGTPLRFGTGGRPRELDELAADLDALLDRYSAVLRREQRLSAEISHELRTPLAGIVAEAELFLTRARTREEAGSAMDSILQSARRLERILDTLLAASRVEAGGTGRADVLAAMSELGVQPDSHGELPAVGVEAALLERMVSPVLDNASRYGTHASVRIHANSEAVIIEVLDDGPGVPPGRESEVFEPGVRLNPLDGHQGSGLGLALARRLARAAGGDLACTPGPRGHFTLRLPRA